MAAPVGGSPRSKRKVVHVTSDVTSPPRQRGRDLFVYRGSEMSSKLKVALSKASRLPALERLALRRSAQEPRAIANRFYLKVLPRMATLPKAMGSVPRVSLWLWLIGYVRIQWPQAAAAAAGRRPITREGLRLLARELQKYQPAQNQAPMRSQNAGLLKPDLEETSLVRRLKRREQN